VIIDDSGELIHYGILRRSGRYPWGSGGDTPEKRSKTFLDVLADLKARLGWGDNEIAEHFEISSGELRQLRAIAKAEQKAAQISMAQRLHDKGMSNVAIADRMGLPGESSVRALLAPGAADKANLIRVTADKLKEEVAQKGMLDVGSGVENYMGISKEKKDTALALLQEEGYQIHSIKVPQPGTGNDTRLKVLVPPGQTQRETFLRRHEIQSIQSYSNDGGRSYFGIVDPLSVNPDRLAVRYAEQGGKDSDGVIYVRPGVDDLSLGGNRYAQVRVKIGENHYIKGMAIYKDDLPEGVDLVFNTNKSDTGTKTDALKSIKDDPDNPFGSYIRRQITEKLPDGTERATSAMNLVNEEGNWGGGYVNPKTGEVESGWSISLASQVLSKQSPELAKGQLNMTMERRLNEFDEIMALTNPTVKRKLLEEFADKTQSASVHLKAAALPRQRWQVILPVSGLKETEIFAPNFNDGERVALIRYPHGGTFEIPELTVNNRHAASARLIGRRAKDAVGINPKTAERLSGADFDGDTVLVIPNDSRRIRHTPALEGLKDFDPQRTYPPYDGMRTVDGGIYRAATRSVEYPPKGPSNRMQNEMGNISNLITDMTIKNASHAEIAAAVRHSMVVIDSEKKSLNYRESAIANGIPALKQKYQGSSRSGASTLISLATSTDVIPERAPRRASRGGPVDPTTGRRVFEETGRTRTTKTGAVVPRTSKVAKLDLADDAHTLSSGTPMERIYADHSNRLKTLADRARLAAINTPRAEYSPSAARTYERQVATLNAKLDLAIRNRPLERQALILANATLSQRRAANPNMDPDTVRKIKFQALEEARRRTGAIKHRIKIEPDEWKAIQEGAISDSKLAEILRTADMDRVRELATPRTRLVMSPAKIQRARQMADLGFTQAQIARQLGVSDSTITNALNTGDS
jgi:DNA-binding transcriptional regulator YiaG